MTPELAFTPVQVSTLLDRIYDELLAGAPLQQSIDLIRSTLSACFAVLTIETPSPNDERVVVVSGEADYLDRYDALTRGGDPIMLPGPHAGECARADAGDAVVSRLFEEAFHATGAHVGAAESTECRLRMFRPRSSRPFTKNEAAVCSTLLSHVRRAIGLTSRLELSEAERQLYSSTLDRLFIGAIILDGRGFVLRTTAAASAVLESRLGLHLINGRPHATNAHQDRELQAVIKEVLAHRLDEALPLPRALSLARPDGTRDIGVVVQAIPSGETATGGRHSAAAIFIRDPEQNAEVENDFLRRLFDLTPSEASVARRLAEGLSLEQTAAALGISRNTARAHLRAIFSKSGITRQTELVRLMLNSAAVLGSGASSVMPSSGAVH